MQQNIDKKSFDTKMIRGIQKKHVGMNKCYQLTNIAPFNEEKNKNMQKLIWTTTRWQKTFDIDSTKNKRGRHWLILGDTTKI